MEKLEPIEVAVHQAKVQVHRLLRWIDDRRDPLSLARSGRLLVDLPLAHEDRTLLWNTGSDMDPREWPLELGKVENLRVAARALDGLEFEADQVFSFWAQVGPPVRARGYVAGRELREGCVVPGIGGGLCLLSNALFGAARGAGFELLERHPHSRRPPGSRAALGEDATVAWNYVDLRFVAGQPWRLEVRLDAQALIVAIRTERRRGRAGATATPLRVLHERRVAAGEPSQSRQPGGAARWVGDEGRSCMSCDQPCDSARVGPAKPAAGRRSWLVDAAWPEYIRHVRAHARPHDRLLQPIDGELLGHPRYAWPRVSGRVQFPVQTLARSLRSRKLASQGPARQRALLEDDRRLAAAMAARLEPHDTELVVAQNLLAHLWQLGALGGRRVSVLMQRLPLLELQAQLDEAHARNPDSPTLADFRTDPWLAEAESRALDDAVEIITPHAGVATYFPGKTTVLEWARATGDPQAGPRVRTPGPLRLWLPTSSVGRKGVWELREALSQPGLGPVQLWIAGRELEGPRFWSACVGVTLEHGSPPLAQLDAVVLPAWIEHQPRALLRAVAAGVPVIASSACGLGPTAGVHTITAGDVGDLRQALAQLRGPALADPGHGGRRGS
ncbi:Vancomycin B-type resistance protein VanW [Enhygromyxa salina]|uniref:Vancomycin B-type resistance protein VanW n=2 Tax=Enhygromyxa salina TaxID=215803 RepID=A0A0C2DAJ7_9BACT|nr:Vancomycin B-type resistance protein VanW [Enhygromyxa salina]